MHRFAIVVLNYRTPGLVVDCLKSYQAEIDPSKDCVVVVDNASGDGSAEEIATTIDREGWSDWCRLIESPKNGGFSAGNNIGMRAVEAEHYWLTNSDTLCRPGAVRAMADAVRAHPHAGLLAPRLEWPDGTPQISWFRFPTHWSCLIDGAVTGPITRALRGHDIPIQLDEDEQPQWVSFAAVLVSRDLIESIGLMDEGYFMYFEDVDYCKRAVDAGWEIATWPDARVVHLRGGSSPVKQLASQLRRRPAYYYESRTRYFLQHRGRLGWMLANGMWGLGRLICRGRLVLGGNPPRQACQREWLDIWTHWRQTVVDAA